jgi:ERCC4-type nuclease
MIFVDTREQNPIWNPMEPDVVSMALKVGDYTTTDLLNFAHIERKSPQDLYSSIIQGHERFRAELTRALEMKIKLAIFVECSKEKFISKQFPQGYKRKCTPDVLRQIVTTLADKYNVEFVWCKDREDFKSCAIEWFIHMRRVKYAKSASYN